MRYSVAVSPTGRITRHGSARFEPAPTGARKDHRMDTDALLAHVLIQLAVIVGFARLGGIAARRLGQPVVCGEIAAGLFLGPSILGNALPGVSAQIFTGDTAEAFTALSE